MPKRNTRKRNKSRHGGSIAAAIENVQSASGARLEKTKQQVTQVVDKAKTRAQQAVHRARTTAERARTTAENTVAKQINQAATAIRPKLPPPTTVAKNAALDIITPVHHAIDHAAHTVHKVIARTPGVSAHRVAPATHQAHTAANHALHKQQILHAAQKQHRALVAPIAGGSRKRRRTRKRTRGGWKFLSRNKKPTTGLERELARQTAQAVQQEQKMKKINAIHDACKQCDKMRQSLAKTGGRRRTRRRRTRRRRRRTRRRRRRTRKHRRRR